MKPPLKAMSEDSDLIHASAEEPNAGSSLHPEHFHNNAEEIHMAKIVVVYHSGYGHTAKQAEAVAQGAGAALHAIDQQGNLPEAAWQALDAADAIVMGTLEPVSAGFMHRAVCLRDAVQGADCAV